MSQPLKQQRSGSLAQLAALTAVLFAFWVLMSGYFTAFLLAAGVGCAIGVALLAGRMEIADREGLPVHLTVAAISYWPWLVKEILKSGWQVARIILHPRLPISPALVRFKPSQSSTVGLVTHANSITLTPGTVTVEADHGEFLVHAITLEGAEGLAGSEMDRRVSRFEGRGARRPEGSG
jgi:multicomponent Na+:H+ antiporter subunit E